MGAASDAADANAPGRKSTANIAITAAGEHSRMASVSRFLTRISTARLVRVRHCRVQPGRSAGPLRSEGRGGAGIGIGFGIGSDGGTDRELREPAGPFTSRW